MEITDYHAKYFAHELVRQHPSGNLEGLIPTLMDAQVDLNPHQIEAALFAFKSPLSKGAILADEVGLGKTIEAGILLSQKWAERKKRILIIVPSSLRKQWNRELLEKFFLNSFILETTSFNKEIKKSNENPFEQNKIIICSYQFARNKSEFAARVQWDLVVIDEAHRLRNVYKKDNKIAKCLRDTFKGIPKILLTATPLQNSLMELYGLVSFVDEYIFGDLESFKAQYSGSPNGDTYWRLRERLAPICKRNLRRQVREYIPYTNRISMTQNFTPDHREQVLYGKVSEYLQRPNIQSLPSEGRQLVVMVLRKLLASSTFAIAGALNTIINRLKAVLKNDPKDDLKNNLETEFEALVDIEDEWEEEVARTFLQDKKDALSMEIKELEEFYDLAISIEENAKGEALINALSSGFNKAREIGSKEKAIIFTESKRTQDYLLKRLEKTQHNGKIVLFNGSNNDKKSKDIYREWKEKHKDSDLITSSRTADMRSALVDYFKNDAQVMIATEAAAEGINLQFCSIIVNYDLPWNPQRIEQRIGRCHRYGQKHDVVVINFLNMKNAADQRVFELLEKKFKLFEGIFGASDEVLGAIESGVDFEKRIFKIYQQCRTNDEIQSAFDNLQDEMSSVINQRMRLTKQKLIENFDEEVTEKLRISDDQSKEYLNKHEEWLWEISRHILNEYAEFNQQFHYFNLNSNNHFENSSIPLGPYKMGKNIEDAHIYRPRHPLALKVIEKVMKVETPLALLTFDYSNPNSPRITILETLIGSKGYLSLHKLKVQSFEYEDHLIFSAVTDGGKVLDIEQCKRLFSLPAKVGLKMVRENDSSHDTLSDNYDKQKGNILKNIEGRNNNLFVQQIDKLDSWEDDKVISLRFALGDIEKEIKALRGQVRQAGTMPEKILLMNTISGLKKKKDGEWRNYESAKEKIGKKTEELIEQVKIQMSKRVEEEIVFKIRWQII